MNDTDAMKSKDGTVIIKHGKNATSDKNVNEDLLDAEEL